jgi:hypothetical protein
VHVGWQVVEQESQRFMNRFRINQMEIVQDGRERIREGDDIVNQAGQNGVDGGGLGGLQRGQGAFAEIGVQLLDGSDKVNPKLGGVIIALVEREPGHAARGLGDPLAEQSGFAETGRGGDQGELFIQTGVEALR